MLTLSLSFFLLFSYMFLHFSCISHLLPVIPFDIIQLFFARCHISLIFFMFLQFCWECGGPFHTVVSCSRPRIVADAGSILAFDDLDKRCASHFLSRQVAQKGRQRCLRLLGKCAGEEACGGGGAGGLAGMAGRVGRGVHGGRRVGMPSHALRSPFGNDLDGDHDENNENSQHRDSKESREGRESRDEGDEASVLRVKAEGWAVLADSQVPYAPSNAPRSASLFSALFNALLYALLTMAHNSA